MCVQTCTHMNYIHHPHSYQTSTLTYNLNTLKTLLTPLAPYLFLFFILGVCVPGVQRPDEGSSGTKVTDGCDHKVVLGIKSGSSSRMASVLN